MHPGFSEKSVEAPQELVHTPDTPAEKRQASRVPIGEKGLGRLAAARLGERMEVFTRPNRDERWLHVEFRWSDFDDMNQALDEVQVGYEYKDSIPLDLAIGSGTIVIVQDLSRNWMGRVPGRPAIGRSRTRLGRLKQDLELLLRPLDSESPDFSITLESDYVQEEEDIGLVTPRTALLAGAYRYEFAFQQDDKDRPTVKRILRRNTAIAEQFDSKKVERFRKKIIMPDVASKEGRPNDLECGPFEGAFLYNPPPSRSRAKSEDVIGHGVLLYRDGVLVEPYGLSGDDWLGVGARKAQRQGYALVQPATFWGEVLINRSQNPELRDMANRQGLIENEASQQFLLHARAEFRHFESIVSDELEQRWTSKAEKAKKLAGDRLHAAQLRSTAFTHAIRQPLMGLGVDLFTMNGIIEDAPMPQQTRSRLRDVYERIESHLGRADRQVERFSRASVPDFASVPIKDILAEVVADERPLARQTGAALDLGDVVERELTLPAELVHDAIAELVRNAVEAKRPDGREPQVTVDALDREGDVIVRIRDNGSGLPDVSPGTLLGELQLESTKGRPAEGLSNVADLILFVGGSAIVSQSCVDGTSIEISLPGRLSGLRD